MQNNSFVLWLREGMQRLFKKSPKYFRWWQRLTGFITAVTGLPALITAAGITLPPAATVLENKIISIFAMGMFFMTLFPTQTTINSISPQGVPNQQLNPKVMPFTLKADLKQAVKEGKPTEIDPNQKN
jgi:hypothetical protein